MAEPYNRTYNRLRRLDEAELRLPSRDSGGFSAHQARKQRLAKSARKAGARPKKSRRMKT